MPKELLEEIHREALKEENMFLNPGLEAAKRYGYEEPPRGFEGRGGFVDDTSME